MVLEEYVMSEVTLILVLAGIVSWGLTAILRRYAEKLGFVDIPNERSSHTRVVPRSGGLSIVISFFGVLAYYYYSLGGIDDLLSFTLLPGCIAVAIVGLVDDRMGVSARTRILVHLAVRDKWVYPWLVQAL